MFHVRTKAQQMAAHQFVAASSFPFLPFRFHITDCNKVLKVEEGAQTDGYTVLYSPSPLQSYHWSLVSFDMLSSVRRRSHSSGVVWKNKTGSFRTLHHSQLISSDDGRQTFSISLVSGSDDKDKAGLSFWCSSPLISLMSKATIHNFFNLKIAVWKSF